MRIRSLSFSSVGSVFVALASLASLTTAAACNKPDPNASQPDAAYTETVTTASAGATALPPSNAPGGDYDASAAVDAAPATTTTTASAAAATSAKSNAPTNNFAQACAGPPPFAQACAGPGLSGASLGAAASASAAPAASGAAATCGDKPLPPCPMTAWMKANAGPAASNADSDLPALATVLDKIETFAPPGYANWVSISKDGAAAARSGQLDAARASCRSCHTQYKAKYKAEMRARPLP